MTAPKSTSAETLSLLEDRLRRVVFVLNGDFNDANNSVPSNEPKGSAIARLRNLERALQALAAKSMTVSDVLALQRQYPDLFHPGNASENPITLSPESSATLVLAHSQLYNSLSTKLAQLQDTSLPEPAGAANLIDLTPRIERVRSKQDQQARELTELRLRSARVLESWYEAGVLGIGERWTDWEERLRQAEILIRRREAAKKREDAVP